MGDSYDHLKRQKDEILERQRSAENRIAEAARQFCRWYDEYQTDYARAKLRAELRHNAGLPPEEFPGKSTMRCYERMIESYEALHIAATGEPRPNYVERAKGPTVHASSREGAGS